HDLLRQPPASLAGIRPRPDVRAPGTEVGAAPAVAAPHDRKSPILAVEVVLELKWIARASAGRFAVIRAGSRLGAEGRPVRAHVLVGYDRQRGEIRRAPKIARSHPDGFE